MKITLKNVFVVFKENNILEEVKAIILELLQENKEELKNKAESYLFSRTPILKEAIITFLISRVELPIILKPFKFVIKNTINKHIDKLVKFILEKIKNI